MAGSLPYHCKDCVGRMEEIEANRSYERGWERALNVRIEMFCQRKFLRREKRMTCRSMVELENCLVLKVDRSD